MVRYFYAWISPVAVFGTAVVITCPYLAPIVLLVVLLGVVAALGVLAWAIVAALYAVGRSALGAVQSLAVPGGGVTRATGLH